MTDRSLRSRHASKAARLLLALGTTTALWAAVPGESAYDLTPKTTIGGMGAYLARNPRQHLETIFSPSGLEMAGLSAGSGWRMQQSLRGADGARGALATQGARIDYPRAGAVSAWYVNADQGLQQWFSVDRAPIGSGDGGAPVLEFSLGGGLSFDVDGAGRVLSGRDDSGRPVVLTRLWQVRTASGRAPHVEISPTRDASGSVDGFALVGQLAETDYPLTLALATGHPKTLELGLDSARRAPSLRAETAEPADPLAAPPNDTCAGAQVIPGAGPFPYLTSPVSLLEATDAGDPTIDCAFMDLYSRGVWYKLTPTQGGLYTLSTCATGAPATTRTDTVLAVFTLNGGTCGNGSTQIACSDDSCVDRQSTVTLSLNAGTTYYVVAYSYNTSPPPPDAATVQVRVEKVPPPQNDACANPTPLPLGVLAGSNVMAANDYSLSGTNCFAGLGNVSCTAGGRDTVYRFTAPTAGSYSFRVQTVDPQGGGNLVFYSTPTCPGSPGAINCTGSVRAANRNALDTQYVAAEEIACQTMTAGQVTYLLVDECAIPAAATAGGYAIEAWRCGLEAEANGTPATATAFNSCPMEGASNTGGDADFFSLGTPASGTRVFAVADTIQTNDVDYDLRVTTGTDTLEYDDENNALRGGELGANVAGTRLTGVASYLRVNHHSTSRIAEPYHLFRVLQPPGGDAYGSSSSPELREVLNDSLQNAEAAGNGYYRGVLVDSDDLDAYRFCAIAGDWITIGTDLDPGRDNTPIDSLGLLYDQNGDPLVEGNDAAGTASSTTPGAGSLTANTPTSNGEAVVWRARYTGAYYAAATSATETVPLNADYLLSIGVNCQNGLSPSALLNTNVTAPAAVNSGATFSYHVILSNSGTHSGLDAEFTSVLAPGVEFVDVGGTGVDQASCDLLPVAGSGGTVRCRVDCLRPGGSYDFELLVRAGPCATGTLANNATATCLTGLAAGSVLSDSASTTVSGGGTCDDGDPCTLGDACSAGVCVSTPVARPASIADFGFSSKTTLSWDLDAAASGYDLVRGVVSALPVGPGNGDEVCFNDIHATSTTDATVPPLGTGFWYVVRGQNTCTSPGTYGNNSQGLQRLTGTCP